MDGFLRQAQARAGTGLLGQPGRAALLVRRLAPGRDGLPRRARDPELLGLRAQLRAPGPHVPAGHLLEPARPPVHGLGMVGALSHERRPDELRERGREPARAARTSRRTRPAATRLRVDRPDLPPASRSTSRGATTSSRAHSPTAPTTRCLPAGAPEREDARDLEPAALVRPPSSADHQLRNIEPIAQLLRCRQARARCRRSRGSSRRSRVSEHPPNLVTAGQTYVTGVINADHARAPTGGRPRSSSPGTTGAASTTTSCRRRSTRTATGCGCPAS